MAEGCATDYFPDTFLPGSRKPGNFTLLVVRATHLLYAGLSATLCLRAIILRYPFMPGMQLMPRETVPKYPRYEKVYSFNIPY
ncbi:hypothetical protein [Pontibacter pudoricolor]|uniref:hypothetical protein n=1 Tax=Pontibacter pudoricolor TaxID=2694930 RepID=UPI001390E615|nr:hypothetical protein [Pontibacter pudoricolor]